MKRLKLLPGQPSWPQATGALSCGAHPEVTELYSLRGGAYSAPDSLLPLNSCAPMGPEPLFWDLKHLNPRIPDKKGPTVI